MTLDDVAARENVAPLGPSGTGTHLAISLGDQSLPSLPLSCLRHRLRMGGTNQPKHMLGPSPRELTRLGRIPLLIADETGYIPIEAEAANLVLQLVSARYE